MRKSLVALTVVLEMFVAFFSLNAQAWVAPVIIDDPTVAVPDPNSKVLLKQDGLGNATLVWSVQDAVTPGFSFMAYSMLVPNGNWTPIQYVLDFLPTSIDINQNGDVVVGGVDTSNAQLDVGVVRKPFGSTTFSSVDLAGILGFGSIVSINNLGDVAIGTDSSAGGLGAAVIKYAGASAWEAPQYFTTNPNNAGIHGIIIDETRITTAVYYVGPSTLNINSLQSLTKTFSGGWSGSTVVAPITSGFLYSASFLLAVPNNCMGIDASGNITLIWTDDPGVLYASRSVAGTNTWSPPIIISDPSDLPLIVLGPSLSVTLDGNVTTIWGLAQNGSVPVIIQAPVKSAVFTVGAWLPPTIIASAQYAYFPNIVTNLTNYAVSVWGDIQVTGQIFSSSRSTILSLWNAAQTISNPLLILANLPAVSLDAGDYSVSAWLTQTGGSPSVAMNATHTLIPEPTFTSISPSSGPTTGGTVVVITGTNFFDVTSVSFGSVPATNFVVNSSTQITAESPSQPSGVVNVVINTDLGPTPVTPASEYTYVLAAAPSITSIAPNQGPIGGGTAVLITGSNFTGATTVFFGGIATTNFIVNSDTSITVISPASSEGTVNITVETDFGVSTPSQASEFTAVNLFPPSDLTVKFQKDKFLTQTDLVNVLTWQAPINGVAPLSYRIYRNPGLTDLIGIVQANENPLRFIDHNRQKNRTYTYFVVSVDQDNAQSVPASATIET